LPSGDKKQLLAAQVIAMQKNVGGLDQKIRFVIGGGLLLGSILAPVATPWRIGMAAVAVVAITTAFTGL
jgi:hypothetical protein